MHPLLKHAYDEESPFLDTLKRLVEYESPTRDREAATAIVEQLERELELRGWSHERSPQHDVGDHLIARCGPEEGERSLILAHYDTVWPIGTLNEIPYRRDGDSVYGPGTSDMKAGIALALHAPAVAAAAGRSLRGPLTLLLTSDEEIGSLNSRDLIEAEAVEHDRVFVVEPGREDGALKVGRKGGGGFWLTFRGRSAHAGNNPADGASALRELAHFLFFVEGLNDEAEQTSVNLTVAGGGSVTNVIAEEATATVDMRALTLAEAERVESAIRGYTPRDPRVTFEVTRGGLNRPPLEPTERNGALLAEAEALLADFDLDLGRAVVGGGSDGNFTSAMGIPTLDGLGCAGAGMHARHEHIRLRETLERLALLAGLISR
jgi:glutamate carboxypeptidase